jgi:hypothetical protein
MALPTNTRPAGQKHWHPAVGDHLSRLQGSVHVQVLLDREMKHKPVQVQVRLSRSA